jgi:hypothetical protein
MVTQTESRREKPRSVRIADYQSVVMWGRIVQGSLYRKIAKLAMEITRQMLGAETTKSLSVVAPDMLYTWRGIRRLSTGLSEVNMADGMQKDWRELCLAVTNEGDSTKLTSLVQELIEALDRGKQDRHPIASPPDAIAANPDAA